jgi:nitrile hydratase accessory protein
MSGQDPASFSDGPSMPGEETAFANPWQARAFAIAVALNEAGHLDWSRWTRLLGEALVDQKLVPPDPSAGNEDYYKCWVAALERVCAGIDADGETTDSDITR